MSWLYTLSSLLKLALIVDRIRGDKRPPEDAQVDITDAQATTFEILDGMLQEDGFDTVHNFEEKGDMVVVAYVKVLAEIPLWVPDGVKFPLCLDVGVDRQGTICHAELLAASYSNDVVSCNVLDKIQQLFAKKSAH